jgi:hypothetical protein
LGVYIRANPVELVRERVRSVPVALADLPDQELARRELEKEQRRQRSQSSTHHDSRSSYK